MPKKTSDSQEAKARFWSSIAEHVEDNLSIFTGPDELTRAEADIVMRQARALAETGFDDASDSRTAEELRERA